MVQHRGSLKILLATILFFGSWAFAQTESVLSADLLKDKKNSQQIIETYFNEPGFNDQAVHTIEDKLVQLIDQSTSGSNIHLSMYTFNRLPIALSLLRASARDVNVRIVMDDKNKKQKDDEGTALYFLKNGTDDLPPLKCGGKKQCITFCKGGCRSLHINHNKFFLFSELNDGSRHVVAQTSANLTKGQLRNYNDLIVVKNDKSFYKGFVSYWKKLNKDNFSLKKPKTVEGENGLKSYFFPRILSEDPVLEFLENTSCYPGASIYIIQSRFDDSRLAVAKRLKKLKKEGCLVQVIVRNEPKEFSPGRNIVAALKKSIVVLPFKGKNDKKKPNSVHSKIFVVDALYEGQPQKTVLTGSHNLSLPSLFLNDEALLRIKDADVYDAYLQYWKRVIAAADLFKDAI